MNRDGASRQETDDAALLAETAHGSEAAFARFMERHQAPLFVFILRSTGERALAADIAQECFVRVWFRANSFRPDSGASAKTWLYSIALNLLRDEFRRRGRFAAVARWFGFLEASPAVEEGSLPPPPPTPRDAAEKADRLDLLSRAIAQLPEKLRLPLVLCSLEGMDQNEAAMLLGTTRKSVELRLRRARESLRERLGKAR